MFDTISRDILILFPKKPLFDWANYIFPKDKLECSEPMAHDEGDIFLIPEFTNHNDAIEYVKENFIEFFKQELFDWTSDESLWPEKLTWELFDSWFHYSIQSVVMDTLDEEIKKDDF
jgi:hypothetical protein